jgi:hypothetical protein
LLFIPVCTLVLIAILSALKINGSSIGSIALDYDPSPQAAFDLRGIRSDEWHLRTPMVVRQDANDFARTSDVGMGVHDVGVLLDFPVRSPAAIAKPHSWLYFVVDVERAFAAEWWLTVFGPFLGVYAVLAVITRTRLISALAGVLASAAPVMAWWTVPWLGLTVLYGGLMAAAVIRAGQIEGRWRYVLFGLGGWAGACCAMELYLPWVIPTGLLFTAVAVSQLTRSFRDWKQCAAGIGCVVGVFGIVVAIFAREHRVALDAIANAVYPGRRRSMSGEASPILMFGAPLDSFSVGHIAATVAGTNQSEAASGLMLWLPVALVGGAFTRVRSSPTARALAATIAAALVLVAWALVPVPSFIGRLLGLTSVIGIRMVVALTVAGALAAGLYAHRVVTDPAFRPARNRVAIAVCTFVFITAWAAVKTTVNEAPLSRKWLLVVLVVVAVATACLLLGRVRVGLGLAAVLLLFSTTRVNPLQVGLRPLLDNPMLAQVHALSAATPGARWANLDGDIVGFAVLAAANVPTATGVDLYAVPDAWHRIDPTDAFEPAWNRFANVDLSIDNAQPAPLILSPQADLLYIVTPSCTGVLQQLGVTYVTRNQALEAPCLSEVARPSRPGERWIYQVVPG